MSKVNIAHSVRQRLKNISRERNEDYNLILIWYALERLIYRIAASKYADNFVLKGAMLFSIWTHKPYRTTKDLDLLAYGDSSAGHIKTIFQEICAVKVEPDGLNFEPDSVRVEEIREGQEYQGQRVHLLARLENAKIRLQIDIGFGDVITPEVQTIDYPTLLDFPAPHIKAYPCETFVAEKLQAIVALGIVGSRMKDYYDLWVISRHFSLNGITLVKAIKATFNRRKTAIPNEIPSALTNEFAADGTKTVQWRGFLKRNKLEDGIDLSNVVQDLRQFLLPPLLSAAKNDILNKSWPAGGPWS
jgi:predicted nucleotidyltransferase component of viral defense system